MKKLFILILLIMDGLVQAQNTDKNILLRHDNKPIDFTKVNEITLKVVVAIVIKSSDGKIKNIIAARPQTILNVLVAFDNLGYELSNLAMKISLIQSTYSDKKIRETT